MRSGRWKEGMEFEHDGFHFRVIKGQKTRGNAPLYGDLILQMRLEERGWRHVPDAVAFIIADFKYENEDVLYPPEHGKRGGEKHIGELRRAIRHGWYNAQKWLEYEQGSLLDEEEVA